MKNITISVIAALVLIVSNNSMAQNLVRNPQFTQFAFPAGYGWFSNIRSRLLGWPVGSGVCMPDLESVPIDWRDATCQTPDYFNSRFSHTLSKCSPSRGILWVPNNAYGNADDKYVNSSAYAGIMQKKGGSDLTVHNDEGVTREYLLGRLCTPLIAGHTYTIKYDIYLADVSRYRADSIGIYFPNSNWSASSPTPQILDQTLPDYLHRSRHCSDPNIMNYYGGWKTVSLTYLAIGGETEFIIGVFGTQYQNNHYGPNINTNCEEVSYEKLRSSSNNITSYPYITSYYYIDNVDIEDAMVQSPQCCNFCDDNVFQFVNNATSASRCCATLRVVNHSGSACTAHQRLQSLTISVSTWPLFDLMSLALINTLDLKLVKVSDNTVRVESVDPLGVEIADYLDLCSICFSDHPNQVFSLYASYYDDNTGATNYCTKKVAVLNCPGISIADCCSQVSASVSHVDNTECCYNVTLTSNGNSCTNMIGDVVVPYGINGADVLYHYSSPTVPISAWPFTFQVCLPYRADLNTRVDLYSVNGDAICSKPLPLHCANSSLCNNILIDEIVRSGTSPMCCKSIFVHTANGFSPNCSAMIGVYRVTATGTVLEQVYSYVQLNTGKNIELCTDEESTDFVIQVKADYCNDLCEHVITVACTYPKCCDAFTFRKVSKGTNLAGQCCYDVYVKHDNICNGSEVSIVDATGAFLGNYSISDWNIGSERGPIPICVNPNSRYNLHTTILAGSRVICSKDYGVSCIQNCCSQYEIELYTWLESGSNPFVSTLRPPDPCCVGYRVHKLGDCNASKYQLLIHGDPSLPGTYIPKTYYIDTWKNDSYSEVMYYCWGRNGLDGNIVIDVLDGDNNVVCSKNMNMACNGVVNYGKASAFVDEKRDVGALKVEIDHDCEIRHISQSSVDEMSTSFIVDALSPGSARVSIYDVRGIERIVCEDIDLHTGINNYVLPLRDIKLADGIYIIKIDYKGCVKCEKVLYIK